MNGFWCGRSIFVTGCTGLLGSWLVQELCDRGGTVIGLIRDRVPQSRFFQEGLDRHLVSITGSVENYGIKTILKQVCKRYNLWELKEFKFIP
ncbi:NAD-dependent epimerase/dehydratase family protein [Spirulina sp. 06S082]|uniref:NAD-dependent epimerase/dehydratase family protein n=1 Tax=Spirulina sp. 06S082 TaxID=3110248 RepID=UPI002B202979|nr:NAD-dependent epimerase/dehydratase family protein [Spirulina sp. 06S082]MEA5468841.1 NAD-dependent epimerase/dehydratase family protein [Spirulina sp. 06S082]